MYRVLLSCCLHVSWHLCMNQFTSTQAAVELCELPPSPWNITGSSNISAIFSSYSIDVITWHSPTQTKLLDFPFKSGNANDTVVISFKKHAYFSVCKSLEKVFLYKIIHPVFLSSHIYYPSPSICEVVKFDCKMKKLPWERVFCREKECFAVRKSVLPWERVFCREKECFAVRKSVLPWERVFCREKECFAVRKSVLPWERKFCRDTCGPPYTLQYVKVSEEFSISYLAFSDLYLWPYLALNDLYSSSSRTFLVSAHSYCIFVHE